eukprot:scaffold3931_cov142-Skeletonema_dohrnii-CCMP3373.AAC.7
MGDTATLLFWHARMKIYVEHRIVGHLGSTPQISSSFLVMHANPRVNAANPPFMCFACPQVGGG